MPLPEMTKLSRLLLALLFASATTVALAQERLRRAQLQQQTEQQRPAEPRDSVLRLLPADAVSQHTVDIPAGKLAYTATAGTLSLFDQSGDRSAAIFYTAYVANGAETANRPHLRVQRRAGRGLGVPQSGRGRPAHPRVRTSRDGAAARLQDNPDTWLAFTDLVLIDPVGAGWSRPAKPDGGGAFWGVQRDAEAMAKTIALYIAKNGRSASPKYILGESYGGFRAAKVARALQREQGIILAGIVMVSPLIEGSFLFGATRFPLGAALHLPRSPPASSSARGPSRPRPWPRPSASRSPNISPRSQARRRAARPGAASTSASPRSAACPRRWSPSRAASSATPTSSICVAEGKIVSRYDATFAVTDPYPESEYARGGDPLLDGLVRAYGGAFAAYARDELGFNTEMTYVLLSSEVSGKWDWGEAAGGRTPAPATTCRRCWRTIRRSAS